MDGRPFPWKKPRSHYDTDGPETPANFEVEGVAFRVAPTGDEGIHTGRGRFLTICSTCQEVLHRNTTSPSAHIERHLRTTHREKKSNG